MKVHPDTVVTGCAVIICMMVGTEVGMLAFKCGPIGLHIGVILTAVFAAFVAATQPT
jgi:hypothetical protein